MMIKLNQALRPYRISEVERDTGIAKETLRVWERRYAFPKPYRDAMGERLYPFEQVVRLKMVKRLQDQGYRPGKLLNLDFEALETQVSSVGAQLPHSEEQSFCIDLLNLIRSHDWQEVRKRLDQCLIRDGLKKFVTDIVAPMNVLIGNAWAHGQLSIPEEHFYTEQIQTMLRHSVKLLQRVNQPPKVLLTTFPDEQHTLGILMVEALCTVEGAQCISLGGRIPIPDILDFADAAGFNVVALSFSRAYTPKDAIRELQDFRARLPSNVEIWAGGGALTAAAENLAGIHVVAQISDVSLLVSQWRSQH